MPSTVEGISGEQLPKERSFSQKKTANDLSVDLQITPLALDAGCWEPCLLLWQQNCPERRKCINIVTNIQWHQGGEQRRK